MPSPTPGSVAANASTRRASLLPRSDARRDGRWTRPHRSGDGPAVLEAGSTLLCCPLHAIHRTPSVHPPSPYQLLPLRRILRACARGDYGVVPPVGGAFPPQPQRTPRTLFFISSDLPNRPSAPILCASALSAFHGAVVATRDGGASVAPPLPVGMSAPGRKRRGARRDRNHLGRRFVASTNPNWHQQPPGQQRRRRRRE